MNEFCKIYVNTTLERKSLMEVIAKQLNAEIDNYSIETAKSIIDFSQNEDFNIDKSTNFPDGFLYFNMLLDIDPKEDIEAKVYIQEISKILLLLWEMGTPAIASCAFEDLLPKNGGYKDTEVPWKITRR